MKISIYFFYGVELILGLFFIAMGIMTKYHPSKKLLATNLIDRAKYISSMFKLFMITGIIFIIIPLLFKVFKCNDSELFSTLYIIILSTYCISWRYYEKKYGVIKTK